MASNIWIRATTDGSTWTDYILSGTANTPYSGSGTPWTSQATTPYAIGNNSVTGQPWTPLTPPALQITGGGPPFANGRDILDVSYDNVQEVIPIQAYASNHDNLIALVRQLRRLLGLARFTLPPLLGVQPDGAAAAVYFEILDGDIDDNPLFINAESGKGIYRGQMRITRSPFGGRLSTGESVMSSASFANSPTATPDDIAAYNAGNGDMIHEGSPLNVKWVGPNSATAYTSWMFASVLSRQSSTSGSGAVSVPASGTVVTTAGTLTATSALTNNGISARILLRATGNTSVQVRYYATMGDTVAIGPWVSMTAVDRLYDLGRLDLDAARRAYASTAPTIAIFMEARSVSGGSTSYTYTHAEYLLYYTFCKVSTGTSIFSDDYSVRIYGFHERTNRACLPCDPAAFTVDRSTDELAHYLKLEGTPPRYYAGASLWVASFRNTGAYTAADTSTMTVTHAPLWKSLRGAG